jgi:hypothetical protein
MNKAIIRRAKLAKESITGAEWRMIDWIGNMEGFRISRVVNHCDSNKADVQNKSKPQTKTKSKTPP